MLLFLVALFRLRLALKAFTFLTIRNIEIFHKLMLSSFMLDLASLYWREPKLNPHIPSLQVYLHLWRSVYNTKTCMDRETSQHGFNHIKHSYSPVLDTHILYVCTHWSTCATLILFHYESVTGKPLSYPQSNLHFEGAAWSGVLQREVLVQCHVFCLQQASQGERQRPQGTFVLLIRHLAQAG